MRTEEQYVQSHERLQQMPGTSWLEDGIGEWKMGRANPRKTESEP